MQKAKIFHVAHDHYPFSHVYTRPPGFPYWLASYRESGTSVTTVGGDSMRVDGGWFALTRPEVVYGVRHADGDEPWIGNWVSFLPAPAWLPLMERLPAFPLGHGYGLSLRGSRFETRIASAFHEMLECVREGYPHREWVLVNALERILLLATAATQESGAQRGDTRIREVIRHLHEALADGHCVESMAGRAHLSAPRFAVLFKQETGSTPMRYLETLRLARAQELLLSTSEPVNAIARWVGFQNAFHFTARFRRRVGQSPSHYRLAPKGAPLMP